MAIRNPLPDLPNLFILGKPKKKGLTFFFDSSKTELSAEQKTKLLNNLSARLQEMSENDLEFENKSDVEKYLKEIFGSSVDLNNPSTINNELNTQLKLQQQTGELQASQYKAPEEITAQIEELKSSQQNFQRDVNKTLPLLQEALAGATGTAKQKELSLLILRSGQYNKVLKQLLSSELQSGAPFEVAISNTLQKARGNPAIATIIAMANTNTQKNIKDLTVEDLLNIDQKTAELVAQKVKDSAPQNLKPDEIPQKAQVALEAKFQVGSKQNLEKILIASGKTQEQAVAIINEINTQAVLGTTPQSLAKYIATQHALVDSNETVLIVQSYANNVQDALEATTGVHPIFAKYSVEAHGKKQLFQQSVLGTNQTTPQSPITGYVAIVGYKPQSTQTSTRSTVSPIQDFTPSHEASISFLIDATDANIAYYFTENRASTFPGDFNFISQTNEEGGGLGGYLIQMGMSMTKDAAEDKIKEQVAGWVVKAGLTASGVGAPFVAAYEAARNMPVIGGVIKKLEKEVLEKGWKALKKMAVLGGAILGGGLAALGILISKGIGFVTSVGAGAIPGFIIGNALFPGVGGFIGGGIGGIGGGLANFFWPQISGAASNVWSGLGSLLSSAGSGLSSLAQSFIGGLSSLGGSVVSGVGWMVGGTVGLVGATTLFTVITASSTFLTDIAPFGASEYLTLTKTSSHTPSVLENNTGSVDITYTITLKPKNNAQIVSVDQITDTFSFVSDSQNLPPLTSPLTPQSFSRNNAGDYVATYQITINTNSYPDTAIVNTIAAAVTLTTEDNQTVADNISANRRVIVGDPPIEFPYCWPTSGQITQAPNTGHLTLNDSGEAVDIGQSDGNMVYASHDGTIIRDTWGCGYGGANGGYGNCFAIVSPAGYSTIYGHLSWQNPERTANSPVHMGDLLGIVGSTGNSTGPHLHYELVGINFSDLSLGSTSVGTNVVESCSGQN